jgi:two-component system, NarL family, sensor histidine kinase BarA
MHSVAQSDSKRAQRSAGPGDNNSVESLERRNAALEEENRKLQLLAEYRSVFLARLAHELRTPLTSILGFSEIMLSQEQLSEAQRGFCERIQNSAQQLQASLNQLADLSRLEAGRSELHREEFSLDDLLRESCTAVAREAQKQKTRIRFETVPGLALIVSDRGKLRQVLYNFLSFAIARSPDGAEVLATAEKNARGFLVKIEDEGQPFADGAAFVEPDLSNQRSGNSELGLAIARHNLDLLGATLSFCNREPRGLLVAVQLPPRPPEI